MDYIRVQTEDFDHAKCYEQLRGEAKHGAIVTFTGIVRDFAADRSLAAIELEQYPAMTLQALEQLVTTAQQRFSIGKVVLIHRIGRLEANQQIVFVGVASQHRQAAFEASQFLMDRLKNDVPLWKKEVDQQGNAKWVEAKQSDVDAGQQWED